MRLNKNNAVLLLTISSAVVLLVAPCRLTAQLVADDLPEPIPTAAVPIGGEEARPERYGKRM